MSTFIHDLESNGAGRVLVDYPGFPDFWDDEMPMRHRRMMDLRNKFLAHSSTEGTRVQIVPPGVPNPLGGATQSEFDLNIGKRRFPDLHHIEWLLALPLAFEERLHTDVSALLRKVYGRRRTDLNRVFELATGHEKFSWT
jgi:hypothetical protein